MKALKTTVGLVGLYVSMAAVAVVCLWSQSDLTQSMDLDTATSSESGIEYVQALAWVNEAVAFIEVIIAYLL